MGTENINLWIAIVATAVFVLTQIVPMLFGIGIDLDGIDAETGDIKHPNIFEFISFRNLVVFFMGYGWGAYILTKTNLGLTLVFVVALGIFLAVILVFVNMLPMKLLLKLQQKNEFCGNIVGLSGTVTVPVSGNIKGKIRVTVGDMAREYYALSDDGDDVAVNTPVTITKIFNDGITVSIEKNRRN